MVARTWNSHVNDYAACNYRQTLKTRLTLCLKCNTFYRPQTKFAKVMSTAGFCSGGLCTGGGSVREGVWAGVSVQGGLCPRRSLSRGDLCPSLSRGVSVRGRVVSVQEGRGVSVRETPYGNVQAVRILLECILVLVKEHSVCFQVSFNSLLLSENQIFIC